MDKILTKAITILTTGLAISFLAFSLFVGGSKNDV